MEIALRAKPWKILSLDDGRQLLIKTNFDESAYDVLVSDKVLLWHERLTGKDIERRIRKLNPGVEAPLNKILNHLRDNCEDLGSRTKNIKMTMDMKDDEETNQQNLILMMRTELAALPFVWRFITCPANNNMISVHLIIPMLTISAELIREQEELYKQLHNKDKEIEDLRAQGVKVTRKRLETVRFDEAVFKQEMIRSKGFEHQVKTEGELAFKEYGHQLYKEVMLKQACLHNTDNMDKGAGSVDGSDVMMDITPSGTQLTCDGTSPKQSPQKPTAGSDTSPTKDLEELRRQELENRLAEEMAKKEQKRKKKKLKL